MFTKLLWDIRQLICYQHQEMALYTSQQIFKFFENPKSFEPFEIG